MHNPFNPSGRFVEKGVCKGTRTSETEDTDSLWNGGDESYFLHLCILSHLALRQVP